MQERELPRQSTLDPANADYWLVAERAQSGTGLPGTDIMQMDAGELREYVARQLAEADEASYDADGVGWGIDRLASISGSKLPQVLRELADDVGAIRS